MKILSLEKFKNNKYKKDENWIEERNSSFFSLFRVRSEFCQKRKQRQNSWRIPYKLKIYRFFVLNSLKFLKNWSRNFWIRRLWFLLISTNWMKYPNAASKRVWTHSFPTMTCFELCNFTGAHHYIHNNHIAANEWFSRTIYQKINWFRTLAK